MKAFKKFSSAKKASNGLPIIKVGDLYIVSEHSDLGKLALTEIAVLVENKWGHGVYAGNVSVSKLNRLGNANHATPSASWSGKELIDWYGENKEKVS